MGRAWAPGPGPGPGPGGPGPGPEVSSNEVSSNEVSSNEVSSNEILEDEFLSKNMIFGELFSNKLTLWRIVDDFPDFYEHIKIPWRNSEPDAPNISPRSPS